MECNPRLGHSWEDRTGGPSGDLRQVSHSLSNQLPGVGVRAGRRRWVHQCQGWQDVHPQREACPAQQGLFLLASAGSLTCAFTGRAPQPPVLAVLPERFLKGDRPDQDSRATGTTGWKQEGRLSRGPDWRRAARSTQLSLWVSPPPCMCPGLCPPTVCVGLGVKSHTPLPHECPDGAL